MVAKSQGRIMPEELLKVGQACEVLKISRTKLYELITEGALKSVKVGCSRRVFSKDLTAYMENLTD